MCGSQFDYLAVGISPLKCQCSFVGIWSISINSSHVTGPHLKATLSLWKHQTNLRSCQTPQIMKTQKTNSESSKNNFPTHMKIHFLMVSWNCHLQLGVTGFPKLDVFLENSQTAFDPPPSLPIFGNYIALFLRKFVNMR